MQLLVLYRLQSEHARETEEFVHYFDRVYPEEQSITMMDADSVDGVAKAELYDVTQFPGILVIGIDGKLVAKWQGDPLPLVDEVAGYLRQ